MTTMLLVISVMLSIMFLFMNHPLSFGLVLLMETMIISVSTSMMSYNSWFSYIIFLIMVGGMLVLFIYMTSVASNEKFKFSTMLFILLTAFIIMATTSVMMDQFLFNVTMFNYDLEPLKTPQHLFLTKYINYPSNMIMSMVITYLLVTLIMVVKITNVQYGPLRQKI